MQSATTPLRTGTSTNDQKGWSNVPRGSQAVVEIVASYRGTVLDVQQVAAGRRSSSAAWFTTGALVSVVGLGLFAHYVSTAAERTRVQATQADAEGSNQRGAEYLEEDRSAPRGFDFSTIAAGLALLGLIPFVIGLQARQRAQPGRYTIGEGHNASFPAPCLAPDGSGELSIARLLGDETIVAFTPEMTGVVETSLGRETVAGLCARHRTSVALRPGGRASFELGDLRFLVRPSSREALLASRRSFDKPALWSQVVSLAVLGAVFVTAASVKHQTSIDAKTLAHNEYTTMLLGKLEAPPAPTAAEKQLKQDIEDARQLPKPKPKPKPTLKPETKPLPDVISDLPVGPKLAAAIPRRKRGDSHNLRKTRKSGVMSVEEAWQAAGEFAELSEESGKLYMPNASDDELWDAVKRSPVKVGGGMILDLQGKGRGGGWHDDEAVGLSRENVLANTGMGDNQVVAHHVGDARAKFDAPVKKRDRSGAREKLLRKAGPATSVTVKPGGRTQAQVARVANNNGPALRKCQDRAGRMHSDLEGTVEVAFAVEADGSVDDVEIVRNTTSARALGGCVARAVRKFHFGPGKATPRVTYKMQLHE